MKLITLNTWGGTLYEPLVEFIKKHSVDTDVFCFQEILEGGKGKTSRDEIKNEYEEISRILQDYTGYFSEYGEGGYYSESSKNLDFKYGVACFVRNTLNGNFVEAITLYDLQKKWNDYSGRFAAGVAQMIEVEDYAIVNVHGLWQGSIKIDTEAKIEQSIKIINLADKAKGKKVICGDFNLLPETKSIHMLGEKYKDLIKEYEITDTRSSLYAKEIKYSDYAFLDKEVTINNFSVPDLNVSDHLPLLLEFD
jgi:endonuclease/exonuclease/phosphatase family metal-dependent hydrolase